MLCTQVLFCCHVTKSTPSRISTPSSYKQQCVDALQLLQHGLQLDRRCGVFSSDSALCCYTQSTACNPCDRLSTLWHCHALGVLAYAWEVYVVPEIMDQASWCHHTPPASDSLEAQCQVQLQTRPLSATNKRCDTQLESSCIAQQFVI